MSSINEIKEIVEKNREYLYTHYHVKSISLFGSYAKQTQNSESDLDLLVEFAKPISLLKLIALENHLSDLLDLKVDLVPKANLRKELEENIVKEALSL
jgi:uncharacterized protein